MRCGKSFLLYGYRATRRIFLSKLKLRPILSFRPTQTCLSAFRLFPPAIVGFIQKKRLSTVGAICDKDHQPNGPIAHRRLHPPRNTQAVDGYRRLDYP